MEKENNQRHRHRDEHKHHHNHHRSHRSEHGEKKRESRNNDSQKKVVKDRMKEVRWEKVYKPIIQCIMALGFVVLIVAIIWFLANPEDGTRKNNNITPETVIKKQEELKADLIEQEKQKENEDILKRIKELEKRVEDLEYQLR